MSRFGDFATLSILLYVAVDAHQYFKKRGEVLWRRTWLGLIILGSVAMISLISATTFGYANG